MYLLIHPAPICRFHLNALGPPQNSMAGLKKLPTRLKSRRRPKTIQSDQRIISWARKQKQKNLIQTVSVSPGGPLVCPLVDCVGDGHVNGVDLSHVTLSGCPVYHNLPFEKWTEMRSREEGIVTPPHLSCRNINPKVSPSKLMKSAHSNSWSDQFRTVLKEPPLNELASPMEIYQFRCAQQRLVIDKEKEAKEHLIMCARIACQQNSAHDSLEPNRIRSIASTTKPLLVENPDSVLKQRIRTVVFGDWQIEPTYLSAYPPDLACLPVIYVCEYCLTPMRYDVSYDRHRQSCTWRFPPGDEIYRKDQLSFFEVDGEKHPDYCRNLCLLTKLFLKHKTVHALDQVPSFLFYILTEFDTNGYHIVGYFSKQKPEDPHDTGLASVVFNNLSCILTLPQHQCCGYGRMLIELSYILSLMENRIGSPERPLSDLGLILYRKYWKWEILSYLSSYTEKKINIRTVSQTLGITIPDIVSTLLDMKLLVYFRTQYYIINNKAEISRLLSSLKAPDATRRIDRSCLHWIPRSVVSGGKLLKDKCGTKNKGDETPATTISK